MTKEWLFNITEIDPNSMLYDPNQEAVTMFVTISEEDANVYNVMRKCFKEVTLAMQAVVRSL